MKKEELIKILSEFPNNLEVEVHYEICCSGEIEAVYEDKENNRIVIDLDGRGEKRT